MKRQGNLMPEIAAIDNLMLAFCKARRGKLQRQEVIDYSFNVVENLLNLREKLLNETLQVGNYHYFEIYDPKKRKICAASFEERIVHHAIINVCKDRFERNLIFETYATREGKGVYAAINRARATPFCSPSLNTSVTELLLTSFNCIKDCPLEAPASDNSTRSFFNPIISNSS